tara:strand:+ start:389 stop:802 length:414 start_codon:yes stop_codon:yes gene_type:complete
MLKIIKNLLFLASFVLLSCMERGELVGGKDLVFEFENIWWEIVDPPVFLSGSSVFCYYFDTTRAVEAPEDGVVLIYEEGDTYSHVLGNFERVEGGYYISEHNVILEIFSDEYGNFSTVISNGMFNHRSGIIPCSLGQ